MKNKNKIILGLFLIIVIASFLRIWQLDSLPPGIWPDEAVNANDAIESLSSGNFQIFYPDNHGREGLFVWLIALSFSIFGISIWSFKIVSALTGILTVLGQYLLSKEILGKKEIALLSSFFLAISFWHINFSRIGFRGILLPLVLVFSFYFFFRGLRTEKIRNFIFSGIIFGTGFYTYISFRTAVILLGFTLAFWLFLSIKEKKSKIYFISACLLLLAVFFTALPIGIYFLKNPNDFMSRAMGVSVFEQINPIKEFVKSFASHFLMLNFRGDFNWRHNLSGFPQLSFLTGVFFLIGLLWGLKRIIFSFKNSGIPLFLIVWIFSLLLPSALTIEGIPHALRSIGAIPAIYLFSGIGAYLFYQWCREKFQEKKWSVSWLNKISVIVLLLMFFSSSFLYFVFWAKSPELKSAFTTRFVEVGEELNSLPDKARKYVIKNEGDLPVATSKFIEQTKGKKGTIYLSPQEATLFDFLPGDFILTMNKEIDSLQPIRERFPQGLLQEKKEIWLYEIYEPIQ
jgi:4-amino-4-deoxy-L-arabinose transferase-like glycosyltransferase